MSILGEFIVSKQTVSQTKRQGKIWDVTKNAPFVAQRDSALYYGSWLYGYNLIVSFKSFD